MPLGFLLIAGQIIIKHGVEVALDIFLALDVSVAL